MARRRHSKRRGRGSFGFLYKLLSVLVICGAILAAMTLFFRVDEIVVTGQKRYTAEEIQAASGVEPGSNLYLLNKYNIARSIVGALPYIEDIRVNRKLPDTLLIEVHESGRPFVLEQEGSAWLISASGRIVEQLPEGQTGDYGRISGCELLAPSVGTSLALATEYALQESSLLDLLAALEEAGLTENVDGIRLDDLSTLNMDYIGRFTVRMAYGADYAWELEKLTATLAHEVMQSNMTGTIDLQLKSEEVRIIQNVR